MKYILIFFFSSLIFSTSCNDRKIKRSGKIDVQLLIYNNPIDEPYDVYFMPISTMFFEKNNFIEIIPQYGDSSIMRKEKFALIKNEHFQIFDDLNSVASLHPETPLKDKNVGVKFVNDIVDYYKKENMADTTFNGFNYKRVRIVSDTAYTVFYIHQTDTILPFSLSPQFDKDYNGILNRVDTYEKYRNRFTSLRLLVSDTIPEKYYKALKLID